MKKESLDKKLKFLSRILIIIYIIMISGLIIYSNTNKERFTYEEKPLNIWEEEQGKTYYSLEEMKTAKKNFFLFYLFNVICILGFILCDPDKRRSLSRIEEKIKNLGDEI